MNTTPSDPIRSLTEHQTLVQALCAPAAWPHPVERVEVIQTHISTVLLAGSFAYKLKKPLALPFLDFSTLAKREAACAEELRINRRTAPELYLDLVPVTGSVTEPKVGGRGAKIDMLLRMRRFDPALTLDRVAARAQLGAAHIDQLAVLVAQLHAAADLAPASSSYGTPDTIARWAQDNLTELRSLTHASADRARVDALANWTQQRLTRLKQRFAVRRAEGRVREGHGDLHLANIVLWNGLPLPFDALEFNAELRFIDVVNDIAFLFMDLLDRGQRALAWRWLNDCFEHSGDYGGVATLPFYAVYRALVRAKVALLHAQQPAVTRLQRVRDVAAFEHYLALAEALSHEPAPRVILMSGPSGSGKSTVAALLSERIGALRVRSDVERKRIYGVLAGKRVAPEQLYSAQATERTYQRLLLCLDAVLDARAPVIIDAAFLKRDERERFVAHACARDVPVTVLACIASPETMRARVAARASAGNDASDATVEVLERQLQWADAIAPSEQAIAFNTDGSLEQMATRCDALVTGWTATS